MKKRLVIGSIFLILLSSNSSKFNSEKWKKGNERQRGKMSHDIINNQILNNKS